MTGTSSRKEKRAAASRSSSGQHARDDAGRPGHAGEALECGVVVSSLTFGARDHDFALEIRQMLRNVQRKKYDNDPKKVGGLTRARFAVRRTARWTPRFPAYVTPPSPGRTRRSRRSCATSAPPLFS